ncbi:hypothetical protein BJ508DRAFT_374016 [Ascobolus immersus RN42]|uniref:Uncharacterized protein n=1 Tax=Ascobolus immersus RN42 TaxID=1160509 RepID=A0A3N4IEV1_ASCIM|nr:hypothetical protein BJ508DRAFT_374016 [Ascobolus immersus RN42]
MRPDEVRDIESTFPHRSTQIQRLSSLLLSPTLPSPPVLVLYGQPSTGKTSITKTLLQLAPRSIRHVWAPCTEYITSRQLCERVSDLCRDALDVDDADAGTGRCENVGALAVRLGYWVGKWVNSPMSGGEDDDFPRSAPIRKKFILVLDSMDAPIEANPLFLPALGRIPESIPGLTLVLIMRNPKPNMLHATSPPHIFFPSYTKTELITILSLPTQTPKMPSSYIDSLTPTEWTSFWSQFTSTIHDTLARPFRDLSQFRLICRRIFPLFLSSIRTRGGDPKNFSECYIRHKEIFRLDSLIAPSLLPSPPTTTQTLTSTASTPAPTSKPLSQTLPTTSKFLLIAAHLASFTQARHDYNLFTAFADSSSRRRRINTSTVRSTPNTPSKVTKPRQATTSTVSATTAAQKRGMIPRNLLGPQTFGLERWLAIYRFLSSVNAPNLGGKGAKGGDLSSEVATLGQLRLVVRVGGGSDVPRSVGVDLVGLVME